MPIVEDALRLVSEMGWEVFPLRPRKNISYKTMAVNGRRWGASRDPEEVERDFRHWPRANLGLPTGSANGIFILEADTMEGHGVDGPASLEALQEEHGPLPTTLMVGTPSEGTHYYLRNPAGLFIRNSTSQLGPGIDIRGEGGMVVCPPSTRRNGAYRWMNWGTPIAVAPKWLLDLVGERPRVTVNNLGSNRPPPSDEELTAIVQAIHNAPEVGWHEWNNIGMAIYAATQGSDFGFELFDGWSRRWGAGYDAEHTQRRWRTYDRSPPDRLSVGSLFYRADQDTPGWRQVYEAQQGVNRTPPPPGGTTAGDDGAIPEGLGVGDLWADLESHKYIYEPTGRLWPSKSVDNYFHALAVLDANNQPKLDADGEIMMLSPSKWLDQHKPIHQIMWAPGENKIIPNKHLVEGGWMPKPGAQCYNTYRPPNELAPGPRSADPTVWLNHVRRIYPDEADHLIKWMAWHVQHPGVKVNHSIVLLGAPGIGKDLMLKPLLYAVGPWNVSEIMAPDIMSQYTGYLQCIVLRINGARDMGEMNRYQSYERTKVMMAAPPDVIRVNDKYIPHRAIINCCGVVITMNSKDSLFLPEGDRWHYVAMSDVVRSDHPDDYFNKLVAYYEAGGYLAVRNYLATLDLAGFDAKAPPPETQAFWEIVENSQPVETPELVSALNAMGNPTALTIRMVQEACHGNAMSVFYDWLTDRKNRNRIPGLIERAGYQQTRNPNDQKGRWRVRKHGGEKHPIFVKKTLSGAERIVAARDLSLEGESVVVPIRPRPTRET